jgi:hypothetical protein
MNIVSTLSAHLKELGSSIHGNELLPPDIIPVGETSWQSPIVYTAMRAVVISACLEPGIRETVGLRFRR